MYRVILSDGDLRCDRYERTEHGIEAYVDGEMTAFVPYENLHLVLDETVSTGEERSIW